MRQTVATDNVQASFQLCSAVIAPTGRCFGARLRTHEVAMVQSDCIHIRHTRRLLFSASIIAAIFTTPALTYFLITRLSDSHRPLPLSDPEGIWPYAPR